MSWKRDALELAVAACYRFAPRLKEAPPEPRSIFVLRNNDLGDLLVVTPLFDALRCRFPNARIVAGVGEWAAPILEKNPNVDEVRIVNAPWHNHSVTPKGKFAQLVASIGFILRYSDAACHDIGIDVLGSPFGSLLLMRAGIPFRLGVRGYAGGHSAVQRYVEFNSNEHVGRSALSFAELFRAKDLPENRPQLFIEKATQTRRICICPGGGYVEKCWPIEFFVELAKKLSKFRIVVIGGSRDCSAGQLVASVGKHVCNKTGLLSLRESFTAIAASRLVICNSSVAMHVAAAFRKPCAVVLGKALPDAEQHAAQWAYPETIVLGKSPEENVPSVVRVLHSLRKMGLNIS
jgi:heptosyltransferase-2